MSTRRGPCLLCNRGPRDRALAITQDERGTVSYCHRHRAVVHVKNADQGVRRTLLPVEPTVFSALAVSIWHRTRALRGTLGEVYLRSRGCMVPPPDAHLRFLPANGTHPPSLCALITHAVTGSAMSLSFTKLAADGKGKAGTERDKVLLKAHRKALGVIRLWPDDAVSCGLAVAEGIESALSAAWVSTPVWATVDAGNLTSFPVLEGIESLVIYADHDTAGVDAARACGRRWRDAGREVRIRTPRMAGMDLNDIVRVLV